MSFDSKLDWRVVDPRGKTPEEITAELLREAPHPEAAAALVESAAAPVKKVGGVFRRSAEDTAAKRKVLDAAAESGEEGVPRKEGRVAAPSSAQLARKKRAVVGRALASGEDPLEVMLDNMRWAFRKAVAAERLMGGIETSEEMSRVVGFRKFAQDAAQIAAPYIHAKLAPKMAKGESGLVVNLVISDV